MEETSWHSYPKVYALGHYAIREIFDDPVIIEEKVDGSQFSFGIFDGEFKARSRGSQLNIDAPEAMFKKGVEAVWDLPLKDGWTYRGEYLKKPKHNALAYDRVPERHVILFDINPGYEKYLPYEEKCKEAKRIGFEVVPQFHIETRGSKELLKLLDKTSILGGQTVEGVVVKNYHRFGADGKVLMGKFVSEKFKEVHTKEWKAANPNKKDIIEQIIEEHRTVARWNKGIQHLREADRLLGDPKDIGPLLLEIKKDVGQECKEEIIKKLWKWAWPQIERGVTRGFPEWYKEQLLENQFRE